MLQDPICSYTCDAIVSGQSSLFMEVMCLLQVGVQSVGLEIQMARVVWAQQWPSLLNRCVEVDLTYSCLMHSEEEKHGPCSDHSAPKCKLSSDGCIPLSLARTLRDIFIFCSGRPVKSVSPNGITYVLLVGLGLLPRVRLKSR